MTTQQRYEISQVERFLMLDMMIHPEMTLEQFHDRHGISYDDNREENQ